MHLPDTAMDDDIAPQDQRATSHLPVDAAEPHSASVSDHQPVRPISPLCGSSDPVSETNDAILHNNMASVSSLSVNDDVQTTLDPPDHDWSTAWATASPSDTNPKQTQHLDQWEAARQEKEKLNRVVVRHLCTYRSSFLSQSTASRIARLHTPSLSKGRARDLADTWNQRRGQLEIRIRRSCRHVRLEISATWRLTSVMNILSQLCPSCSIDSH